MIPDMLAHQATALALQSHGVEFADPDFGLPLTRLSKASMGLTSSDVSEYTDQALWNSDDSLWRFTGGGISNGFKITAARTPGASPLHVSDYTTGFSALHYGAGIRWDPQVRTRLWFFHRLRSTTASTTAGSAIVTLADRTGLQVGDTIFVIGAGAYNGQGTTALDQGMLKGQITSIGPGANQVTLNVNAVFSVSGAECRRSDWLSRYDLDTSTNPYGRSITKVRDFTEYFKISIDSTDPHTFSSASQSWQEFSDDGQWVAVHAIIDGSKHGMAPPATTGTTDVTNSAGGAPQYQYAPRNHEVFTFNPYTLVKRVVSTFQSPYALPVSLGGIANASYEPYGTMDSVDAIDFVAITPGGEWVLVQNDTNNWLGGRWSQGGGANSYSATTGLYTGKISGSLGHGDLIKDSNGDSWYVQVHDNDTPFDSSHVGKSKFPVGVVWTGTPYTQAGVGRDQTYAAGLLVKLFNYGFPQGVNGGSCHISARNVKDPSFIVLEVVNGMNSGPSSSNVDKEIIKVYLDSKVGNTTGGVPDVPHFERLAHNRSTAIGDTGGDLVYYDNPFCSLSRSGEFLVFNSRWGARANPLDAYLLDLAWFKHFPALKSWRSSYQITNYSQGRMGNHNGWKGVAPALGADRTRDGIYACGFHTRLDGSFGYGPYGNDTWRWDPNLWRWILDLDGDVNTSTGSNTDTNASARKEVRRVHVDVSNGLTVQIRNSSVASGASTQPAWTPGTTLVDIWNFQGTIRRAQNVPIASVAATQVVFAVPVTCFRNDLIYPVGVALGPGPTWHSWGTKPWMGHPYSSVRPDTTRGMVLIGSKNSGAPKCNTSHTMRYNPAAKLWSFLHVGYWQDDQTTGQLVHCMDGSTDHETDPYWVPDYDSGECMEYIPSTDEILRFGGLQWPLTNVIHPTHTWILSCSGPNSGNWTRYNSTEGVTNPGIRYSAVCQYVSSEDLVYVMGGDSSGGAIAFDHAWCWNPTLHTWTKILLSGPAPSARSEVSFAYDPNSNKLMVAWGTTTGGSNTFFQNAFLLDIATKTWEQLGNVPLVYNSAKAESQVQGPKPIGNNALAYLPSPYNCFAVLDVRNGMGPGASGNNGDPFYDPHFLFMRLVEVGGPPPPPPPPPPAGSTVYNIFPQRNFW